MKPMVVVVLTMTPHYPTAARNGHRAGMGGKLGSATHFVSDDGGIWNSQ